jgi:hypothetical protein
MKAAQLSQFIIHSSPTKQKTSHNNITATAKFDGLVKFDDCDSLTTSKLMTNSHPIDQISINWEQLKKPTAAHQRKKETQKCGRVACIYKMKSRLY